MGDEHYEQLRYRFLNLLEPGFSLDNIPIVRSKSVFVTRSLDPNQPQSWEGDDKSITPSPIWTIDPYDFSKSTEADGEIIIKSQRRSIDSGNKGQIILSSRDSVGSANEAP